MADLTEVFGGDVHAGDEVALHPTDDLHAGSTVQPQEQSIAR